MSEYLEKNDDELMNHSKTAPPQIINKSHIFRITSKDSKNDYLERYMPVEFVQNIYENSDFLKTLLTDCSDCDVVMLVEDNPISVMIFLLLLSKNEMPRDEWNEEFVKLSSKWLCPNYVEFYEIFIDKTLTRILKDYKISKDNVMISVDATKSIPKGHFRSINGIYRHTPIKSDEKLFYHESSNDYIYEDPTKKTWCLVHGNNVFRHDHKSTQLSQCSGNWMENDTFLSYHVYLTITPPVPTDVKLFTDIVNIILTHACYQQGSMIKDKTDLVQILGMNSFLWTEYLMNTLLDKEDFVNLLVKLSKD